MAARPGTRRGREEASFKGSPARPSTRGKTYLEQPVFTSLQRPTSRRGPQDATAVFSRTTPPLQQRQGQLQRQPGSSWQPAQQLAANRGAAAGQLQENPSQISVSLSDLDAMGSTMSIEADSMLASGSTAASRITVPPQRIQQGAVNAMSSSQHQPARLQGPALEVLHLDSPQQQHQVRAATAGHTDTKAAAGGPTAELSDAFTMSESAYSDDFLSIEGSGVEIEYSEPSVAAPGNTQQQRVASQLGSYRPAPTAAAANTAVQATARQIPATAAVRPDPYSSSNLAANDSVVSGDIEFSSNSIAVGLDSRLAATAQPPAAAAAAGGVNQVNQVIRPSGLTTTAVLPPGTAAVANRLAATPTGGRRAAEVNLQLEDEESVSSYGSAGIDFEPSVAAVAAERAAGTRAPAVATVQHGDRAAASEWDWPSSPLAAAVPAGPAAAAADEAAAAAATDDLFATLLAVPRHSDSSDSTSSASESIADAGGNTAEPTPMTDDSPVGAGLYSQSSSRAYSPATQHTAAAAAAAGDDAQQLPPDALDVLAGLQELHGTLQVVRQLSRSSSDASTGSGSSGSFSSNSRVQQNPNRTLDVARSTGLASSPYSRRADTEYAVTQAEEGPAPTRAENGITAAAAAAQAAAETDALLSSLQAVRQHDLSPSASEGQMSDATDASADNNMKLQQQQQRYIQSYSSNDAGNDGQAGATGYPAGSSSQTVSVDIDDLLRQQDTVAAAGGGTKQAKRPPLATTSTAKRRSVALQVGSSNDKGTQVTFNEARRLLWDGGSLLQQQQQRTSLPHQVAALGRASVAPAAAEAAALGGAAGSWAVGAVPTPPSFDLGRLGGVNGGACWSVLSAALQQFRAAALLDQLESLLKTAATRQQVVQVPAAEQPLAQQQQQQVAGPAASVSSGAAAPVAQPAAAGWFSTPAVSGQLPQQQQQPRRLGSPRQPAHAPTDDTNDTAGGWMALPVFGGTAASAARQHNDARARGQAAAAGAGQLYGAAQGSPAAATAAGMPSAPQAAADSGWFSLPVSSTANTANPADTPWSETASNQGNQLQVVTGASSSMNQATTNSEAADNSTRAQQPAAANHDAGWFSLPLSADTPSGAAQQRKQQHQQKTAEDAGWFNLPVPAAAAAVSTADPAPPPAAAAAEGAGWFSLPAAAAATSPAPPEVYLGATPTATPIDAQTGHSATAAGQAPAATAALQAGSGKVEAVTDSGWMALPLSAAGTTASSAAIAEADLSPHVPVSPASDVSAADAVSYSMTSEDSVATASVSTTADVSPADGLSHQPRAALAITAAPAQALNGAVGSVSRQDTSGFDSIGSLAVLGDSHQSGNAAALAANTRAHPQYTSDFEDISENTSPTGLGESNEASRVHSKAPSVTASAAETEGVTNSQQYTSDFEAVSNVPELNGAYHMTDAAANSFAAPAERTAAGDQAAGVGKSRYHVLSAADTGVVGSQPKTTTTGGAATGSVGAEATPPAQGLAPDVAGDRHPTAEPAPTALQHQQQGLSSTDTMLRYLTYLDALATQGLAPPGLTLATAKSLRDTLLQTVAASQQQVVGSNVHGWPCSAAAVGVGGAGDLHYEDLVASCCLDSFMSSSLMQLKRKLARPALCTAWGVGGSQSTAGPGLRSGMQAAAVAGAGGGGQQTGVKVRRDRAADYWAVPGRHGVFGGCVAQRSRPAHNYTTLEDTLNLIKQHRLSTLHGLGVAGQLR